MLLYIITCDAVEPSSNTQESNSFNVRIQRSESLAARRLLYHLSPLQLLRDEPAPAHWSRVDHVDPLSQLLPFDPFAGPQLLPFDPFAG